MDNETLLIVVASSHGQLCLPREGMIKEVPSCGLPQKQFTGNLNGNEEQR